MELGFIYVTVSSANLFHLFIFIDNFGIIFLSKSTLKVSSINGPKGDPIATPSFRLYNLLSQEEVRFWYKVAKDLSFLLLIS